MLIAIGSSRESNPSRRICYLRAVPLGHVADEVVALQVVFNPRVALYFSILPLFMVFTVVVGVAKTINFIATQSPRPHVQFMRVLDPRFLVLVSASQLDF